MNIKTLEHIHKLLQDDHNSKYEAYVAARKLQHEYEDRSDTDDKNAVELAEKQRVYAEKLWCMYADTGTALEDFENSDWR